MNGRLFRHTKKTVYFNVNKGNNFYLFIFSLYSPGQKYKTNFKNEEKDIIYNFFKNVNQINER